MSHGLEQRVERLEDALQTVLAMVSRTQAQIALLAQTSGTALARACANTANPPVVMEQILQLFDDICLETTNQMERDIIGLCEAQGEIADLVRDTAETTLRGMLVLSEKAPD